MIGKLVSRIYSDEGDFNDLESEEQFSHRKPRHVDHTGPIEQPRYQTHQRSSKCNSLHVHAYFMKSIYASVRVHERTHPGPTEGTILPSPRNKIKRKKSRKKQVLRYVVR